KPIQKLDVTADSNTNVLSASALRFAVAGSKEILIRDAETGKLIGRCPASDASITAIAFAADDRRLVCGADNNGTPCGIRAGTLVKSFNGHETTVKSVAMSTDGQQILSGDEEGNVKLWDVGSGNAVRTFKGDRSAADSVAFSPDGKKLFAGTSNNKVRIWDK